MTQAVVVIDFDNATISTTAATSGVVDVTGMTSGDTVVPYRIRFTMTGGSPSNQQIDMGSPLGGQTGDLLNIELQPTRSATATNQRAVLTLGTPSNPYTFTDANWTFFDVDAEDDNTSGTYSDWQDRVRVNQSVLDVTLTAEDSSYTSINGAGNRATGITRDNVGNNDNFANVYADLDGTADRLIVRYGPGPDDGFGNNQRIGWGNITFQSVHTVPEPTSIVLGALVTGALGIGAARRRRRRSDTATENTSSEA